MFVGNICNPIIEARLHSGYSLTSLAKRLGVSKQYISRAEHGTYSSLNDKLIRYGSNELQIKPAEFITRYKSFQKAQRSATIDEVNPAMLTRRSSKAPGHIIFANWRSGYWHSVIAFSNAFCIHPEIVNAYESGIREDMPISLRDILVDYKVLDPNWTDNVKPTRREIQDLELPAEIGNSPLRG